MGKYLKMADVFKSELFIDSDCDDVIVDDLSLTVLESFRGSDAAKFALHAINSHDELVAEVERLCEIIMLAIEVNESMAGAVPTTDWGEGFKECATATSKALMETASKHSSQWVAYQIAKRGK